MYINIIQYIVMNTPRYPYIILFYFKKSYDLYLMELCIYTRIWNHAFNVS